MDEIEIRALVIPKLFSHVGVPVIEGNQYSNPPDKEHYVFNWITMGTNEQLESIETEFDADGVGYVTYTQDHRSTLSVTSISPVLDDMTHSEAKDKAYRMAQSAKDWFTFGARSFIIASGIAVVSVTEINNRDSINEEEYRQGFDVSIRYSRTVRVPVDYFTKIHVVEEGEV